MTLRCTPTRMLYEFRYSADDVGMRLARTLPAIENAINLMAFIHLIKEHLKPIYKRQKKGRKPIEKTGLTPVINPLNTKLTSFH